MHWLESVQGLPSAAALAALAGPYVGRDAHLRARAVHGGSEEAMKSAGAPAEKIHIEVFKSLGSRTRSPPW